MHIIRSVDKRSSCDGKLSIGIDFFHCFEKFCLSISDSVLCNKNEGNVSLFYVIEIQVKVRIRKLLTASSRTIL